MEPNVDCPDITAFWRHRKKSFPILSIVFEAMSVIPAASADAERPFRFGNLVENRDDRCQNNLNAILALKSHSKWNPALKSF